MLRKLDEWMGGLSNSNIFLLKKKTILNRYRHSYRHRYRYIFKSNNLYLCLSLSFPPSLPPDLDIYSSLETGDYVCWKNYITLENE